MTRIGRLCVFVGLAGVLLTAANVSAQQWVTVNASNPPPARFYQETFGFSVISEFGERGCAMHAGARQVLLLFKKGASRAISSLFRPF